MTLVFDELQSMFMNALAIQLESLGFVTSLYVNDILTYRKKVEIGDYFFHLSFLGDRKTWRTRVNIGVSCYAIEELYAEIEGEPYELGEARAGSIGTELGYLLAGGKPKEWLLGDTGNVGDVVIQIINEFQEYGLRHLRKFETLADVLQALSNVEQDIRLEPLQSPIDHVRAQKAVIAAYLLDAPQLFRDVINREQAIFQKREAEFNRLMFTIDYLVKRASNR